MMLSCFVVKQQISISNWGNTLMYGGVGCVCVCVCGGGGGVCVGGGGGGGGGVATACYSRRSSAFLNDTVEALDDTQSGKDKHESPGLPHTESVKHNNQ